jgi:hypothetical protein
MSIVVLHLHIGGEIGIAIWHPLDPHRALQSPESEEKISRDELKCRGGGNALEGPEKCAKNAQKCGKCAKNVQKCAL